MQGVTDVDQLVSGDDDKFGIGDENVGRLVVLNASEESVYGVGQEGGVGLELTRVVTQHLGINNTLSS
jgi:hypothetical protein